MREPAFWRTDAPRGSAAMTRALLSPLAWLYAWAGRRRIQRTEPIACGKPVICIGNLTVGGTGKTPVAQTVLARLRDMGLAPHALSRGYGGKLKGPLQVDLDAHSASDVGDEPMLLAGSAPAWISRDRPQGAQAAVGGGADLIVMDDGHQNPTLKKDLSIVVVDGITGWGAGQVFPAGPLREPVAEGLARADAVIVMTPGAEHLPRYQKLGLDTLEIPVLQAWLTPLNPPPEGALIAFAGIGRPGKFFSSLADHGADVRDQADYPDHHPYSASDLKWLSELADKHEARLITTEKDWVRLPADFREHVIAWPVRAEFANPAALDALLHRVVDAAG